MTDLSGSVVGWVETAVGPGSRVRSVREMPEWSVEMHDLLVEAADGAEHRLVLRRYTVDLRPPRWTSRPALWERVLEVLEAGSPATRACFIHRDYHQGNTLAEGDRVVAVIDWPTAAWGPPGIDLARMRLNLVEEVDPASERRFLEAYREVGGDPDDRHPYWDLRDAADATIDVSHRNDLEGHDRSRFEAWVASVLAELEDA